MIHLYLSLCILFFFTTLHGMQTWSSDEKAVCLSVHLSNAWIVNGRQNGRKSVQIFIPYERPFSLIFWEEEWLVGATPLTWNFGPTGPHWSEIANFAPIFARSTSAVTSSEKSSINTNRKSNTRFPMSPRWTSYLVPKPPKRGSKTQSVQNLNNKLW